MSRFNPSAWGLNRVRPVPIALLFATARGGADETCLVDAEGCRGAPAATGVQATQVEDPYVVSSTVFGVDANTAYVGHVPSLGSDAVFDLAEAREFTGPALVYGDEGAGWYALGNNQDLTLTRYDRDGAGVYQPGARMSLQGAGVASLNRSVAFVDASKAYYLDGDIGQLIVFDPTEMTISRTLDISARLNREGFQAAFGPNPIRRERSVLFNMRWENYDADPAITPQEVALLKIDTASDEVSLQLESRCNVYSSTQLANGDVLFASDSYASVSHALGALETEPCVLRVRAGEARFDPDFYVPLSRLTDAVAGEIALAGPDAVYIRLLDRSRAEPADTTSIWDVAFAEAWRWYRWDLRDDSLTLEESLDYAAGAGTSFFVDGKTYITQSNADFSQTTLIDMTGPDGPASGITVQGAPSGVLRSDG